MKTQEEIRARFDEHRGSYDDMFGFKQEALFEALEFASVADIVQEGVTADGWHEVDVEKTAREYLKFAVGKVADHRGISASRSVEKFTEWLWVLDDADLSRRFEEAEYSPYGAPKLAVLAEAWGIRTSEMDSEAWSRMSKGMNCTDDCREGCWS